MRKSIIIILVSIYGLSFGQDFWTQREPIPFARLGTTRFSIGNYGYIGLGRDSSWTYLKDFWQYDPACDHWTQKATYPGGGSFTNSFVAVGNYAYVGLGYDGWNCQYDWWRYDPVNDAWTSKAPFPGSPRYGAGTFAIGSRIYIIAGSPGGAPFYSDAYVYNTTTNAWSSIAPFPGGLRNHIVGFAYNGKGYVTCGNSDQIFCNNDLWEYDPILNSWTQKASMPGTPRSHASGFLIGHHFYLTTGLKFALMTYLTDTWEYNILTDTWASRAAFPGDPRHLSACFTQGGYGYLTTGGTDSDAYNDIWQYWPPINVSTKEKMATSNKIEIFPNPAILFTTLHFSHELVDATIRVLNISGHVMNMIHHVSGNQFTYDCDHLKTGAYIILIYDKSDFISAVSFIKF